MPSQDCEGEVTWDDVRQAWNEIFSSDHLESDVGFFLGRLDCLIQCDFAVWATVEQAIDFVKEWRFNWPRQDDPAFGPIDLIIMQCID